MSGVLREDNRHRKRLLFGCRRALPEHGRPRPCERLPKDEVPKGGWSEAELRQSPPATITSLDNAPQSKLRSSAQGMLRLLCDSDAQKMQINRDFTLGTKKTLPGMLTADWVVEVDGVEPTTLCLQSRCSSQLSYTPGYVVLSRLELLTPTLSVWCSNQLSYRTI